MNPLIILLIGMTVVVGGILVLRLHAFLALLAGAICVLALTSSKIPIGVRLGEGFGKTAGGVGILVAMAAVLGRTLMESGAAERIVYSTRRLLGDRRAPAGVVISGVVVGELGVVEEGIFLVLSIAHRTSAQGAGQ